jgi:hypothetical protein
MSGCRGKDIDGLKKRIFCGNRVIFELVERGGAKEKEW